MSSTAANHSSTRTAFITGAAQGIGRAIALRLAHDGFNIAVNDLESNANNLQALVDAINDAGECKTRGRKAVAVYGDVSLEEDVKHMVATVVGHFTSLDVMVANAGIAMMKSIPQTTVEEWDRVFAINTRGVFLCVKHAGTQMVQQGNGGRILAACSIAGKRGTGVSALYSSTKFAIRGLVQSAALEFGAHGITVNAYAPGLIQTAMLEDLEQAKTKDYNMKRGEWRESILNGSALKRAGEPDDIASLVSYLASAEAHYITGQAINADGGMVFD